MYATRMTRHMDAPPSRVYRALLDPEAVAAWRVPDGMTCRVHEFEPRVGGAFRVSLTYDAPDRSGKTAGRTDTYHGHFVELVEDAKVVERLRFESDDPDVAAPMTMTTTLTAAGGGTEVAILHEGIPDAVPAADNEAGTRMALDRLAGLVVRM
ncbi:SRPBCC domain-containing protein [Actinacidiphila acidipaludis]|uniref:SRPBCC domain-containing protein n=1 Tax=Actinacidiphila acidipaludis TaxID=2873382 RepID=A0ABS7PZG1_9ACTN|nr:SRPBCC domain-containing protein [Streptomyces acidipaludis]MBY8876277.1 SRPBCC domain-containing protein [Streptomyces acidipaludis]